MSLIKSLAQIALISLVILIGIEAVLIHLFNYKEVIIGDTSCKQYLPENGFSVYKPDCEIFIKHWEQSGGVEYKFNAFGRRDGSQSDGEQFIAFIGDSFTFGAMVDIDKNYNYRSLYYFKNKKLAGHNYGVAGEQFQNIVNRLRKQDFSKYKYIVYGMTPNDLFDLVDGSYTEKTIGSSVKIDNSTAFDYIKKYILSSAISKFLLHNVMSIDSVYHRTYAARQPYAGYLESPISSRFEDAIKTAFDQLARLNENIKDKLVINILPQRAEVVAMRLGIYNSDFRVRLANACEESGLKCFATDIGPLGKIEQSHFPIDGHLTLEGNEIVGRQLAENLKKLTWE